MKITGWTEDYERKLKNRIYEAEKEAALLTIKLTSLTETWIICEERIRNLETRIEALESLIEDSMKVMRIYINVPEFSDLRSRWEALQANVHHP